MVGGGEKGRVVDGRIALGGCVWLGGDSGGVEMGMGGLLVVVTGCRGYQRRRVVVWLEREREQEGLAIGREGAGQWWRRLATEGRGSTVD